ncbi:hypothetical protein [Streptomyces javensis]|uniref:Uncharacterized protein n=1 Tax=Streptomyces javensis TaxID=114698 RepID=A0ABS0R6S1_9ACTN|nr:hypothetical protein [Streptomyces javensis]MBI0312699.1 hypothetical protein [Streptomyces javensis]
MNLLISIGLGLMACAFAGGFTGRLALHRAAGLQALAEVCAAADSAAEGNAVVCSLFTTLAVGLAWIWWKGGGGDDTKRGLRRLRRAFTPVRRTASAPA